MTAEPQVVHLDGKHTEPTLLGGKGAALDRLVAWGIRVPPTAVVTAAAFRSVWQQESLDPLRRRLTSGEQVDGNDVDDAFAAAGIPGDLLDEIATAARAVGNGRPLAVRSSATVEDLDQSSFAGQYRSLLNIDATDRTAVERAVLAVFSSLFHPAPRAYRAALGVGEIDIAMAAVMMQMIDADRAGVVFTQDPTVSEPTIRVEVVEGLGEELVSGRRTPRVKQFPRTDRADGDLATVVDAALSIEQRAGCPQDIEWAQDAAGLWIVQARPVTALRSVDTDPFDDDPESLADAELTTEGIAEMLPGVLPPLVWKLASHVVEEGFRTMLARLGADVSPAEGPTWLLRRVRGRAALDVSRLSLLMAAIPGGAARIRATYFGEEPTSTERPPASRGRHVIAHRSSAVRARRTAGFDAEVVTEAVAELRRAERSGNSVQLALLEPGVLLARHAALLSLAVRAMAAELTVSADAGAIHDGVRAVLSRYLTPDGAARWADLVTVPDHAVTVSPAASAAVFAGPSWRELGLEPAPPRGAFDRDSALDELAHDLAAAPRWPTAGMRRRLMRRRIEHLVLRAAQQFEYREFTKATILEIGGSLRSIHLEIAQRLVDAGRIEEPDDVDLLTVGELSGLLEGAATPSTRQISGRRRTLARHRTHTALPSRWTGLPTDRVEAAQEGVLQGWAASGGRFVGRARRVDGPQGAIGRDEVLVASATDPSWSPILLRCGALVLERGGPLSHAAILAREFGVPAVFNIAGAATALDGKRLLVDGDAGTVTVLPDEEGAA